ncbi:hypothetical protein NHQ30_003995 [Ciborinia camelliae]|nr:hypothetical protein NHQ30_003995 [Ciborinia camelliae]
MSDPTTPPFTFEVNSIDTPPKSPSAHEAIMPSPSSSVPRTANSKKYKRNLASTLASLYDDCPTPTQVKNEEQPVLASPLWRNSEKDDSVPNDIGAGHIDEVNGDHRKELTPPPEGIPTSDLSEKIAEMVVPAASEPASTQVTEPASKDLGITPAVITDPVEQISNSTDTKITPNVEFINSPSSADVTESLQMKVVSGEITDEAEDRKIRHEWTGTSQFSAITEISIELQKEASIPHINELDNLILYRRALIHDIAQAPHDPYFYIDLSNLDAKLAFSDTASHHAYRALFLLKAGLETVTPQQSELSRSVFTAVSTRLCTSSVPIIIDELKSMYLTAYRCLVQGLMHCGAFWDGLTAVKRGLEEFPGDFELTDLRELLLKAFRDRHAETMEIAKEGKIININGATRPGVIFQKRYPWMAPKLFVRTPRLVREVNSQLASSVAEVLPVVFGSPGTASTFKPLSGLSKTADVGPLGIFAKRDIEEGETILADKSLACVSDVPPSRGLFCDACHAALFFPFLHPLEIRRPSCGCKVFYCSKRCHDIAVEGYHKIQCGIDFGWLYDAGSQQTDWCPIMFLRVICIVLSTPGWSKDSVPQKNPLQHPLVAKMTANYVSNDKPASHPYDWSYHDNIVAPTRILLDLGVDIFSSIKKTHEGKIKFHANIWTPELIQTIYWRMSNNANTSTIDVAGLQQGSPSPSVSSSSSGSTLSRFGLDNNAHLIVLSPCYLFFNHSCRQNVSWIGSVSHGSDGISWLVAGEGAKQEIMKPGSSSIICRANRDIKAGEELTISYVGDPMGDYTEEEYLANRKLTTGKNADGSTSHPRKAVRWGMTKWFSDGFGCGCGQCVEENDRNDYMT